MDGADLPGGCSDHDGQQALAETEAACCSQRVTTFWPVLSSALPRLLTMSKLSLGFLLFKYVLLLEV
jgi:hypothetical protein